jgi:ornithine cyclodeaminase
MDGKSSNGRLALLYVFEEGKIRESVNMNSEVFSIIESGFSKLAKGEVTLPPIMRIDIPENNGEVDVKTAYIKGFNKFAIKISSGFFNNHQRGLQSLSGMMILLSSETGFPEAVFQDNGYLTDVRTGIAGAIAAKYLAKETISTVGIIGTGAQARYQLIALSHVRTFTEVIVYGRSIEKMKSYAIDMEKLLGVKVKLATSMEQLVKESDVVITTTPSTEPLIKEEWLHPGLHITAMGSDAEHKQELDPKVFKKADLLCCDVKKQCIRLGELQHAVKARIVEPDMPNVLEIGQLTSGMTKGRLNDSQITVCDLTGTGVQDTAIALYAYEQLTAKVSSKS